MKTKMQKLLLVGGLAVLLLGGAVFLGSRPGGGTGAGPDTATGTDTIRIGVRMDIRKWGYYNKEAELFSGAEVDYARALGAELGYEKVEFVPVTPENLKRSITEGEVDCLVSKCTIMDTSKEEYEFSPGYYSDKGSLMVEKSSRIRSIDGLVGKKIGVLSGADVKDRVIKKMKNMGLMTDDNMMGTEMVELDSFEELSDALESGDIDAFAADACILRAWTDEGREILNETYQDKEYGVASLKETELSEDIRQAVERLLDKGTMETITKRWYEGGE